MAFRKGMRIEKRYTFISICPNTGELLTRGQIMNNNGICPYCGEKSGNNFVHEKRIVGKWHRPDYESATIYDHQYFVTAIKIDIKWAQKSFKNKVCESNILDLETRKILSKTWDKL